jgi:ABC-type nitrate/sulfonate/bicarbonate transport system substrate-binding protein
MIGRATRRATLAGLAAAPLAIRLGGRAARAADLVTIRMTAGANIGYADLYVAEATGMFKKHGIDGSVLLFDVGFLGTQAVVAGQAETAGTVEFPLMTLVAKGADLVTPAVFITVHDLRLVCLATIARPEDLVGRKIGLIYGSSADYAFDRYLAKFGVPKDKVTLINVAAAEQVALFAKGDIDGFVWLEPMISRSLAIMKDRAHLIEPNIDSAYLTRTYLEMSRDWCDTHPDATTALLRAMIEANEFTRSNPEETARITAKKLNLKAPDVAAQLERVKFDWSLYLDKASLDAFGPVGEWMKANGKLKEAVPDMAKVFAPQYLRAIDPSLVRGL